MGDPLIYLERPVTWANAKKAPLPGPYCCIEDKAGLALYRSARYARSAPPMPVNTFALTARSRW